MQSWSATFALPHTVLGIRIEDNALTRIEFLPLQTASVAPRTALARRVIAQLRHYLIHPDFVFDLPLALRGSAHAERVWRILQQIAPGTVRTYGDIAREIGSSPRAVGQACGANPIPIVIPCHRVVSRSGLGGFMHRRDTGALNIKAWLLAHEERRLHAA